MKNGEDNGHGVLDATHHTASDIQRAIGTVPLGDQIPALGNDALDVLSGKNIYTI